MDVLSDILQAIELKSAVYFQHDFTTPWGMEMPKSPVAIFHIVVRGKCYFDMENMENPLPLFGGDIVLLPLGDQHILKDNLNYSCKPGPDVLSCIVNGKAPFEGSEVSATLICGHFELDRDLGHPLLENLPRLIHIRKQDRGGSSMLETVAMMLMEESVAGLPGSDRILHRLADVLFISVLRIHLVREQDNGSRLKALNDPAISKALELMHHQPESNWTLETIARSAGISRTLLANRFRETVGKTPMSYLTFWRMLKARKLLSSNDLSLREIAETVGYQSESAFNRAFKNQFQFSPGKYRRMKKEQSTPAA